jgi:hypothetical protein
MGQLVKYGSYSPEQARKDREADERAGGGADFWKVPQGLSKVRFLPPRLGKTSIYRVRYQHFVDVPGATNVVSFICPRMQSKEDRLPRRFCPACEKLDELREVGSSASLEAAKRLEPKRGTLANVISRGDPERGPIIWGFGPMVKDQLNSIRDNEDSGGEFWDPVGGFDLTVEKKGQGMKTEYTVMPSRKVTPLVADVEASNAWLEAMHDLDKHCRIPSDEDIRRMMGGGVRERGEQGAAPRAGGRATAVTPRARTAADDVIDTTGEEVDDE